MTTEFETLYEKTVKKNLEELAFFWGYSYVPEFLQTIQSGEDELDLDGDNLKRFASIPKPIQYAFYCWCVEHKKL
jgi:hypothetical protein